MATALTTTSTTTTYHPPSILLLLTLSIIPSLGLLVNAPGITLTNQLLQVLLLLFFNNTLNYCLYVSDHMDAGCHVKVYVAPVPRTASETDIRLVFEGHGTIVEIVLLKDRRTGVRQGSCFVKYATLDGADRAIKALSSQYTFPGESCPVVVRFADRELERLGVRGFSRNLEKKDPLIEVVDKVFVGYINKEASKKEIEDIFSTYGHVEDVFIASSRGYGFVKFSNREMALAAIKGLNGTYTMRGCDHPLIVRVADPKKPKTGESRGNYLSGNANFGHCSQEPAVWPLPNFGDPSTGGSLMPVAPYHSTTSHPQVASHMQNWEPGATVVQQPFPPQQPFAPQQPFLPQQLYSQLASMPLRSIQAPKLSSQAFVAEVQRQSHPAESSAQNMEQHISSQLPTQNGSNPNTVAGSTPPDMPANPQDEDFPECDWSEHYCPDGHKYYYNCVTCESQWEKPEEYTLYEREAEKEQEHKESETQETEKKESEKQELEKKECEKQEPEKKESEKQEPERKESEWQVPEKEESEKAEPMPEEEESEKQEEQVNKEFKNQQENKEFDKQLENNSSGLSQLSLCSSPQK
ncbi:hypothetical protein RJT34_19307 [Clitoria ternatea]|uniref:Flowering time control protein FCA n=1 Tax=Clitoria ternatea TaxID=43366 RepID=A0AAN9IQS5_CLITE